MTIAQAIDRFLSDLALAHAPATVTAYRYGLHRWAEFLDARDRLPADVSGLTIDQVMDYARHLMAVPPVGSSRKTGDVYIAALCSLFAFLVRESVRPDLPLTALRLRLRPVLGRPKARLPRVPSDDVVVRLLAAARDHRPPGSRGELVRLRNVAMLEILRGSGLRVSELVRLRRDELGADGSAVVRGKGGHDRRVYVSTAAAAAIAAYTAARGPEPPTAPLLARHDVATPGLPIAPNAVRAALARIAAEADLADARVTPHRFRAWFATRVLARTGDLAATQDLLGHASPTTTRQYARVADPHLRDVHRRAFADAPG